MSTIQSSAEHLTLNADGSSKDIKFQANGVEKASISSSGAFTSTTIDATKLTGNLPAISGASLTGVLPLAGGTMTGDLDLNDNVKIRLGTGGDLQLYCDNNNSYIKDAGAGSLLLWTGNGTEIKFISQSDGSETMADMNADGSVDLYYNNSKKFETTADGIDVTGKVQASQNLTVGTYNNPADTNFARMVSSGISQVGRTGTGSQPMVQMFNGNGNVGNIYTNGSATSYNTSSDYRLKENVDYTWDATTRLKQLKPARFNFISDDTNTLVDGFIAHEVSSVVPEAISGTKDEVDDDGNAVHQGIDQSKLVPLLVKTIQELEARITALEA